MKSHTLAYELNLELMRSGKFSFGSRYAVDIIISPRTGVHSFSVPMSAVTQICQYVTDARQRSCRGYLLVAGLALPGYDKYQDHEAVLHLGRIQASFTTMVPKDKIVYALACVPGLQEVVDYVCKEIGASISNLHTLHFLVQANPLAVFSWHDDAYDLKMSRRMVTVVVSLNDVHSCMEVWGFLPAWFNGAGTAHAFPGGARHRSVKTSFTSESNVDIRASVVLRTCPLKLALFFNP